MDISRFLKKCKLTLETHSERNTRSWGKKKKTFKKCYCHLTYVIYNFFLDFFPPALLGVGVLCLILTSIMLFDPQIFIEYEIFLMQFYSTKYTWRSCTALLYCFTPVRAWREARPFLPTWHWPAATSCSITLQLCKTSTILITLGLIYIISRCYTKPRLLTTTAALFLIYYSILGLKKTKGEFLSAVCIAIHNYASHTNPFYFSDVKPYWQVPGRQGTTHQNFFPP